MLNLRPVLAASYHFNFQDGAIALDLITRSHASVWPKASCCHLLGRAISQDVAALDKLPHTCGSETVKSFELPCNVSVALSAFGDRQYRAAVFREDVDTAGIIPSAAINVVGVLSLEAVVYRKAFHGEQRRN